VRAEIKRLEEQRLIDRDPRVWWKRKVLWRATEEGRALAIEARRAIDAEGGVVEDESAGR
jgi:DNA-binding MarR family transcriptional regulator